MPAIQRGQTYKLASRDQGTGRPLWAYRFRDENGRRRQVGGFKSKTEAGQALASALDRARLGPLAARREVTVKELARFYLDQHEADPVTINRLRSQLRQAEARFGDRLIHSLEPHELGAWRKGLSDGSRHHVFRALKQVLEQGVRWKWLDENPCQHVRNPKPKAPDVQPFESWDEIDAIADELSPAFAAIPVFAVGTGLRPEEWIALERRDVDRRAGVVTVERVYTQGHLKQCAKTKRQRRRVPVRQRVLDALEAVPRVSTRRSCSRPLGAATSS
jgi:integrase